LESGGKMETNAKCILAMVAVCILITPAFSQGGERDGRNGNQGSNMVPAEDNAMMSGPNGAPFGQGGEIEPGQAPDALRFKGCNTHPQKMSAKGPIKLPSDTPDGLGNELGPQGAQHDESAPGSHLEPGDEKHDDAAFGFAGPDERAPTRSIMDHDHPKVPPKKSLMEGRHHNMHKKPLEPLKDKDFPELPPMKSIMDHGR
jgi:hypothetical protein